MSSSTSGIFNRSISLLIHVKSTDFSNFSAIFRLNRSMALKKGRTVTSVFTTRGPFFSAGKVLSKPKITVVVVRSV